MTTTIAADMIAHSTGSATMNQLDQCISQARALNLTVTDVLCNLITNAHSLRSDNGENVEYDRALVELVADCLGTEDKAWVARGILAAASPLHQRF